MIRRAVGLAASLAALPAACAHGAGAVEARPFAEFEAMYPEHWNDLFADSPTGLRLSTGSVVTTSMYLLYDVKLSRELFPWWRIRYRWRFRSDYFERRFRDDLSTTLSDFGLLEAQLRVWRSARFVWAVEPHFSKMRTADAILGAMVDPEFAWGRAEARALYVFAPVANYTHRALNRPGVFEKHWEIEPFWWELSLSVRALGIFALDAVNVYGHERYRVLNLETAPPTLWALTDVVLDRWKVRARVERPRWPVVRIEASGRGGVAGPGPVPVPAGPTYRELSADSLRGRTRLFARVYSGYRRERVTDVDEGRYDERGWQVWASRDAYEGTWLGARYERRDTSRPVFPPVRHQFGFTFERTVSEGGASTALSPNPGPTGADAPPPPASSFPPLRVFGSFTFLAERPREVPWSAWDRLFTINLQTAF